MVNINIEEYLLDIAKNNVFDNIIQGRILVELLNVYSEYKEAFINFSSGELMFPRVMINNRVCVDLVVRWSRWNQSSDISISTNAIWL